MSHTPEHEAKTQPTEAAKTDTPAPLQQSQNVQYIVTEKSLEGVGGWLIFWIVIFSLAGIGYIVSFFAFIEQGVSEPSSVASMIAAPILAVGFILSTVLIALRQKLGQTVTIATLAVGGLFTALNVILISSESAYGDGLAVTAGGVLVSLVVSGLMILYFIISKRVQKTLTR
jgi:hypothetical protein